MKRTLLACIASALTLIGGHFVNRRWDRAVLFFVVLALWGIGVYVNAMRQMTEIMAPGVDGRAITDMFLLHFRVFAAGVVVLWVVSLALTYFDARQVDRAASYRWTLSGIGGAGGLSLMTGLFLVFQMLSLVTMGEFQRGQDVEVASATDEPPRFMRRHFMNHVYLGNNSKLARSFEKPPAGEAYLRGRFVYQGKPAAGVALTLVLNGKYETARLTTDANGIFTVRLPKGDWTVNRLVTEEWAEQPNDARFNITTGTEPKLAGGNYDEYYWLQRDGMTVKAANDETAEPRLHFTIRQPVALTWPTKDSRETPTKLKDSVVAWEAYPGAESYLVRITELERRGRTTSFHPVSNKVVARTTKFSLASLPALPGEEKKEYQASVLAFAKDGTFLSESERHSEISFSLADNQQLVRDEVRRFAPGADMSELKQIQDNSDRIEAIEVLLKDNLLDEAEKMLGKIQGKIDPGKKAAVTGYLLAKRGRCAEAEKQFTQARSEGGGGCVPDRYRANCKP